MIFAEAVQVYGMHCGAKEEWHFTDDVGVNSFDNLCAHELVPKCNGKVIYKKPFIIQVFDH